LIVLGVGIWVLGIPLSFVIRHRPEHYGYLPDGEIPGQSSPSHGGREVGEEGNFTEALKNRNFWKIGAAEAIRMMITMAVITHVMPYLSSIGVSRGRAALVTTSIPLVSIIGRFGFGWLGDVIEKRYVLAGLYCLLGIGTLAFSYVHVTYVIVPFILFFSLAFGGTISLRGAIVREYFGRASFGRLIGIILGMTAVGGVTGPTVAGWTFDTWGGYQPVWRCFAGATVIAIVLLFRLKAPHQMSQE